MKTQAAAQTFETLSSEVRLEVFRLLVRNAPDGLVAGDIARQLELPPNALSFHLKSLQQAGLAEAAKEGRFLRYRANIPRMLEVIAYLTEECCMNAPEHCRNFRKASGIAPGLLPEPR